MRINERMIQHLQELSRMEVWEYIRTYLAKRELSHFMNLAKHDNIREEDLFIKGQIEELSFIKDSMILDIIMDLEGGEDHGAGAEEPRE